MSNKSNKQVNIKEIGLERIEKALELFEQIEKLFPSNVSLCIHDVDGIENSMKMLGIFRQTLIRNEMNFT